MQRIAAHSPVELLVTDQFNRRTGYDPTTQTTVNEIPGSIYTVEEPIIDQDTGLPLGGAQKVLYLPQAEAGSYVLTVIGIGNGPYTVDFQTIDLDGNFSNNSVHGLVSLGTIYNYSYDYDGKIIALPVSPQLTVQIQQGYSGRSTDCCI